MKLSRILLIVVGSILVLAVLAVAIALTPAVQRWAVLRATASTPGLKLDVARVSAGFSQVELSQVHVEQGGLVVRVEQLEADYSLTQLLFSERLKIDRLVGRGIMVDASRLDSTTSAAGASAPAAAPGMLGNVTLPFELVLADVNLEGRVLLSAAAEKAPLEASFKLTGGKFSPGNEGSLLLVGSVKNPAPEAPVAALNAQITLRATQTPQRGFNRVAVVALLDATGPGLPEQTQLKVAADLARDSGGESYQIDIATLTAGKAEDVLELRAQLPAGQKSFAGEWTLKARKSQLAPFFLGGILPEFDADGAGRFDFAPEPLALNLQGKLNATVSRLEVIDPAWRAFGALQTNVVFDVESNGHRLKLNQLKVSLAGEQPVLDLEAMNAAEFDLAKGTLTVGGTGGGEVLDFRMHGLPVAWIRPFVTDVDLSGGMVTGRFSIVSEGARLRVRALEPVKVDRLNVVKLGVLLLAKADLSLRPEVVLTPTSLEAKVGAFSLRTAAGDTLTADLALSAPFPLKPPFAITASYRADFPALVAAWVPLGRIKSSGEIDATLTERTLDVRQFSTTVADGAGTTLFSAASVRPFALDRATYAAVTESTQAVDLLKVSLGSMSLDKIPLSGAGVRLQGWLKGGEFMLAAQEARLTLSALAPVKLTDVVLRKDGKVLLTGLTIQSQPVLVLNDATSGAFKSGEVSITNARGATLLAMQSEATYSATDGKRGSLTFNVDVPALGTQPLFAGAQAVTQGRASGEIRIASGAQHQVEARMTINGLVAKNVEQTLPVANLSLRAISDASGKLIVQAPILLDRAGQRSDLEFTLELVPQGSGFGLSGKLAGQQVELIDVLAVAAVFQTAPTSPAPALASSAAASAPAVSSPDQLPIWSQVTGQFLLDVKSVTHGKEWSMSGLTGVVKVEPTRVSLEKFDTSFDAASKLTAQGSISFTPGRRPYQLDGGFALTAFDAGKFFKAFDPGKAPTVEGLFEVKGTLRGEGETLARTLERTRGNFALTSRQGIFRGLQGSTGKLSMASKAVELGASVLGSILGSDKAAKTAEKVAGNAYFAGQLAQSLGELNYDQFSVKVVRDDTLNVALEEFSLVSTEIRLLGKGTLTHVEGKALLDYPLALTLHVSTREKFEQLFGKLRLNDTAKDELGFTKVREALLVGGTLNKPDATPFFTKIANAKLSEALAPDN